MAALDIAAIGALLLICIAALVRGDAPARTVAAVYFGAFLASSVPYYIAQSFDLADPRLTAAAALVIDMLVCAALIAVALTTRPVWTMFAAGFQLLTTITSLVHLLSSNAATRPFMIVQNMLWWLSLSALAFGVVQAWRRRGAAGTVRVSA